MKLNKNENKGVGGGVVEGYDRQVDIEMTDLLDTNTGNTGISVPNKSVKINEENVDSAESEEEVEKLPINELFLQGTELSKTSWQEMLTRQAKIEASEDDLSKPPTKLLINLKAGGLSGGIDIFEGPPIYGQNGENDNSAPENSILGQINKKIKEENLLPPDQKSLENDERNLFVLITELERTDFMLHESILDSYRDFLLCDNFLYLMKNANTSTTLSYETRLLYSAMTNKVIQLRFASFILLIKFFSLQLSVCYDIMTSIVLVRLTFILPSPQLLLVNHYHNHSYTPLTTTVTPLSDTSSTITTSIIDTPLSLSSLPSPTLHTFYFHSYTPLTTPLTITQAMALTAELGALVKTESVRHLQTIHDVCEIAATLQQGVHTLH